MIEKIIRWMAFFEMNKCRTIWNASIWIFAQNCKCDLTKIWCDFFDMFIFRIKRKVSKISCKIVSDIKLLYLRKITRPSAMAGSSRRIRIGSVHCVLQSCESISEVSSLPILLANREFCGFISRWSSLILELEEIESKSSMLFDFNALLAWKILE